MRQPWADPQVARVDACPHCANTCLVLLYSVGEAVFMHCPSCKACGPVVELPEGVDIQVYIRRAIHGWNRRVSEGS